MKRTLQWGLPLLLLSGVGCREVTFSPTDDPSLIDPVDPDGLVAGLGLSGPEALFIETQDTPQPFEATLSCPQGAVLCPGDGDQLINKVTNQDQVQPSIATSNGVSLVVFTDKSQSSATPSNTSDIKGRFVNSFGVPQGNDFFINSSLAGGQDQPDVAVSGNTFLVVWRDSSTNPASIKGRRLTFNLNTGTPTFLAAEQTIQGAPAGNQLLQPAVASVSIGSEFVVVWTKTNSSDAGDIGAKRVDADGTLGTTFGAAVGAGSQVDADVVGSSDGHFLVAWTDTQAGTLPDIKAQRFGGGSFTTTFVQPDNNTPLGVFTVNGAVTGSQSQAAVAASGAGAELYYIAWNDSNLGLGDASISSVRGRLLIGGTLGNERQLNSTTANAQAQPAVGNDVATGDFIAAWVDDSHSASPAPGDTSSTSIRSIRVNSEGVVRGTSNPNSPSDMVVNNTVTNGQTQVAIAPVSVNGIVLTAWADASPATTSGFDGKGFGVRSRHLDLGCDEDDLNECTEDVCVGIVDLHGDLEDGTPCGEVQSGSSSVEGGPAFVLARGPSEICLDGECVVSACGDGFEDIFTNEECDDGNESDTDACPSGLGTCQDAECGDGFTDAGNEECDDANTNEDDSCTSLCFFPTCSDGFVQEGLGETCDGGDLSPGDGCSANCTTEPGFVCTGEPSVCVSTGPVCGNGTLEAGEECERADVILGGACSSSCKIETVFFSEYVEGSSSNKALEIKNPLSSSISLASCQIRIFFNGSTSPGAPSPINLTVTIAPGDVAVLCDTNANATISAQCDQTMGTSIFNGDDAVGLFCDSDPGPGTNFVAVDVIGQIGFQPPPAPNGEWAESAGSLNSTRDNTIRRKCNRVSDGLAITRGDTNSSNNFNLDLPNEWNGFVNDTFDGLGSHVCP